MTRLQIPAEGFGLDNLPYGVYSRGSADPAGRAGEGERRCATRVGDQVVDLTVLLADDLPQAERLFARGSLDEFMSEGPQLWQAVRALIAARVPQDLPSDAVFDVADVTMHLPCEIGDYVDFYASEHHAANLGRLFRPEQPDPLMPNWKHLPVGYHGRTCTIMPSGVDIVRPCGQRKDPADPGPTFGPSARLDIEAELGFLVGVGNAMGEPIAVAASEEHLFGAVLFNDWSARDIQAWEYVPLGPHLGKSFASSMSPWVVPMAALQAAKVPTPTQHPTPLPYLRMDPPWGLDVDLEVIWNGHVVSRPPYREMYWSPAQMLAHLTVNGAATRTGDLFASGTISGPDAAQRGAFIELTWGASAPVDVGGQARTFLCDGDTVTLRGSATGPGGVRIDFGEVTATILPARC